MKEVWTIERYTPACAELWDRFVAQSRQGTLLHMRGYMDYHSDRFRDCSLMACRKGTVSALFPANLDSKGTLHSHQGLTYGGWITPCSHFDGSDMLCVFEAMHEWCFNNGIAGIDYKPVPHIYHRIPAEEDIYALFRVGYSMSSVNLSSAIDMRDVPAFNSQQKRNLKKALAHNPWVRETSDADGFMRMLGECLESRHNATPVHTASELALLRDRFPDGIRLFVCGVGSEAEAEVCIYDTAGVAHCQYIATTDEGRRNGTLAYLMHHLITEVFPGRRYFDFGTSNEDSGRVLNAGLLHQKYGLSGRGIAYPRFTLRFGD